MARGFAHWIGVLLIGSAWITGCAESPGPDSGADRSLVQAAQDIGPLLARVGPVDLHQTELEDLAQAAIQLRRDTLGETAGRDVPATKLDLAVEFLALAEWAGAQAGWRTTAREARRRALAQAFLASVLDPIDSQPVSDQQLQQAHLSMIQQYLASGESELYEPTRVDVALIGIGHYPDWKQRDEPGLAPVLARPEIERLAAEVKRACSDRVADLDAFIGIARRYSRGQPTLRYELVSLVTLDPRMSHLPAPIHQVVVGLDGNGAVSPIIWTPGGAFLARRGPTYPGRGEDPLDMRAELLRAVRLEQKRKRFEGLMPELSTRLAVETWPEKLEAFPGDLQAP